MKICLAQTQPARGNLDQNIADHLEKIQVAAAHQADIIIFPELSLTGYEPMLAASLAILKDDEQLEIFQQKSNEHTMIIGVGMPIQYANGVCIGMIIFQPHQPRSVYTKQYLHADEEPFFVSGQEQTDIILHDKKIALAICYELSVTAHAKNAADRKADLYIASVAKTQAGIEKSYLTLAAIAKQYSIPVLMTNCTGDCEDFVSAGLSAVWNNNGILINALPANQSGLLLWDSISGRAKKLL